MVLGNKKARSKAGYVAGYPSKSLTVVAWLLAVLHLSVATNQGYLRTRLVSVGDCPYVYAAIAACSSSFRAALSKRFLQQTQPETARSLPTLWGGGSPPLDRANWVAFTGFLTALGAIPEPSLGIGLDIRQRGSERSPPTLSQLSTSTIEPRNWVEMLGRN